MVSLKYLKKILVICEMPLINAEINFILAWSANCVVSSNTAANQASAFAISDTNLYVTVVTLSKQECFHN